MTYAKDHNGRALSAPTPLFHRDGTLAMLNPDLFSRQF